MVLVCVCVFAWRGNFQESQLNNDLADFSQIWPDATKIYNQPGVGELTLNLSLSTRGEIGQF